MGVLVISSEILKEGNLIIELIKKIEDYILNGKHIIIDLNNHFMSCRNKIYIEDYEIDNDHITLIDKNFEININFDNSTIITYKEELFDECFTIVKNDLEFNLYFI